MDLGFAASLALAAAAGAAQQPPAPAPQSLSDWLTPLVGLATIAQAVFAYFALRGLRDSRTSANAATEGLKLTRETVERQLRAYVCYLNGRLNPPVCGKTMTCGVQFENCGSTPAYEVLAFGTCVAVESVDGYDYPPPPASALLVASRTTLGPNSKTSLWAESDEPLTAETLARIESGQLTVVVYGAMTYRDTFGHARETPFRLHHQKDPSSPDGHLWLCSDGNRAT